MKVRRREWIYALFLLFSVFIIQCSFKKYFANIIFVRERTKTSIFLLTINDYMYLILILILVAFAIYLQRNLHPYRVDRLFFLYIVTVSAEACMIFTARYQWRKIDILIDVLALVSNMILFLLIGYLTQISLMHYFKRIAKLYFLFILLTAIGYIYVFFNSTIEQRIYYPILKWNYIVTILIMIVMLGRGYLENTLYGKKQIRLLLAGLTAGGILFGVDKLSPFIKIAKWMGSEVKNYNSLIQMEHTREQHPILIFSGIIIVVIYILIKKNISY